MTTDRIESVIKELMNNYYRPEPMQADEFSAFHWPKLIPLMRFQTERFEIPGLGRAALVKSKAMGAVHMLTLMVSPSEGVSVPLLKVEAMETKGKSTVFIEYYDCTANGTDLSGFEAVSEKYSSLVDYPEKAAWYIDKRSKGSVSKFALENEAEQLVGLVRDSVDAYMKASQAADADSENRKGLADFCERVINEGMPLYESFSKILGKSKADTFFRETILSK